MHLERLTLVDLVTGTVPRSDVVQDHLATCETCRLELATLEETWEALGAIEAPAPSTPWQTAFRDLLDALEKPAPGPRRWRPGRRVLRVAAVLAAVVLGGVLARAMVSGGDEEAFATTVVEDATAVVLRVGRGDVRVEAHAASFARIEAFAAGAAEPVPPTVVSEVGRVVVEHAGRPPVRLVVWVPRRAEVDLRLERGRVELAGPGGPTLVRVERGDVTGDLRPSLDEPVTVSTGVGDIDVAVPPDTRADILLLCPRGTVRTDFRLHAGGGSLNGGGAPLELLASDGNCTLRKS